MALHVLLSWAASWASACYQPAQTADLRGRAEPGNDLLDLPFSEPEDSEGPASSNTQGPALFFRVQTAPLGGRFAPNNVGAIWVESDQGAFVKTLKVWGRSRAQYLRKFQAASGGNIADAITSATLAEHMLHEVRWDFLDAKRAVAQEGSYRLCLELTDKNIAGAFTAIPFVKDGKESLQAPPDTAQFQRMELRIE